MNDGNGSGYGYGGGSGSGYGFGDGFGGGSGSGYGAAVVMAAGAVDPKEWGPQPRRAPAPCPEHVEGPSGYLARLEWLDRMSETHVRSMCRKCGLWVVWTTKASRANPQEPNARRQGDA